MSFWSSRLSHCLEKCDSMKLVILFFWVNTWKQEMLLESCIQMQSIEMHLNTVDWGKEVVQLCDYAMYRKHILMPKVAYPILYLDCNAGSTIQVGPARINLSCWTWVHRFIKVICCFCNHPSAIKPEARTIHFRNWVCNIITWCLAQNGFVFWNDRKLEDKTWRYWIKELEAENHRCFFLVVKHI